MVSQTKQEQTIAINQLLYDAVTTYWTWVGHYAIYNLYNTATEANKKRLAFVKQSAIYGDRAMIDTVEVYAQLQFFEQNKVEAIRNFKNSTLALSTFLWLNDKPVLLSENVLPDSGWVNVVAAKNFEPLIKNIDIDILQHPKLQMLGFKNKALLIDKKFKKQNMLPKFDVKYNFLNSGINLPNNIFNSFLNNNFKYGIAFTMPLYLRTAKAEYKEVKLKILQNNLEIGSNELVLKNKVLSAYNDIEQLQKQLTLIKSMLESYTKLLNVEEQKFSIGESNLFIVNSRELKKLETQEKLIEVKIKLNKSIAGLAFAYGNL